MGMRAMSRHRKLGALALLIALAMLIAGVTVLNPRLEAATFLVYWLACLVLTVFALFTALIDMRVVRHRIREEQRDLLEGALEDIQKEARSKRRRPHNGK